MTTDRPTDHSTARDRRFREKFVRRAIETNAPLLAARLSTYAEAEGMDWPGLAAHLGCPNLDALNRLAMCRMPRAESFAEDALVLADGLADPNRLLPLLRRLQALDAFSPGDVGPTAAPLTNQFLLAARDREPEAEPGPTPNAERQTPEAEPPDA